MTDPIADILGDYRAFAALQRDRLLTRGIDIAPFGRAVRRSVRRRVPPRRRLGAATARHGNRPEPAAAVIRTPEG
jgi:hypothetical protein